MAKRTLIKCGWLISVDPQIGELKNSEILIEDDRIADVGTNLGAGADETVDAGAMIVMPGLVNAHIHTWQAALRTVGAEWITPDYFRDMHGNMATFYTPDDTYLGNLFGSLCQINCGVTTIYDWCHALRDLEMAERAVDGLQDAGIRALFGHGTAKPPARRGETPYTHTPHPRERVEHLRKNRLSSDDGLVTLGMAILGPEYGTFEVAQADFRLARELDLYSTEHLWHGRNRAVEGEPEEPFRLLADQGLLNEKHNIVHGNYISDALLDFLLDKGVTVTSTVLVELHGHGAEPLAARVRDRGVMPSVGIDTGMLVSDDLISEMRAALIFLRQRAHANAYRSGDYPLGAMPVKSREAIEWATIGNARVMGLGDRIGSISPGKKADLIMLDAEALNLFPVHDPVHAVADYALGSNVSDVMIDGAFRKRAGKLLYPDSGMAKLKQQLRASAERIMERGGFTPGALS